MKAKLLEEKKLGTIARLKLEVQSKLLNRKDSAFLHLISTLSLLSAARWHRHGCLLAHPLLRTVSHTTARRTVRSATALPSRATVLVAFSVALFIPARRIVLMLFTIPRGN